MDNIELLLGGVRRAALTDISKVTVYLTDIRHREAVYRVLGERLRGVFPVFTGLVVVALARPEWLVEVDVIAVIAEPPGDLLAGRTLPRARACWGWSVSSSSPAVAARCAHARAGVGCGRLPERHRPASGRASARPGRPRARRRPMRSPGWSPRSRYIAHRQLTVVDHRGGAAVHSGERTLGVHAARAVPDAAAAGNLLADLAVPQAMLDAFAASSQEHLGDAPGGGAAGGAGGRRRSRARCGRRACWWSTASPGRWPTCGSTGTSSRSPSWPPSGTSGSRSSTAT